MEVFLEKPTYEKLKDYAVKNNLSENDAIVTILKRGMADYWIHEFKQMKISYFHIKKLFEEFKKDNELFVGLENENNQLKSILERKARGSEDEG
ncbi:hypothetical protein KEJ45_00230 [Candidatus Bathyarchaeota archaeon]|nr:hypothetical protein [Candidatus Bathyarchaeota archaeon]